jgi:hypothetical protein
MPPMVVVSFEIRSHPTYPSFPRTLSLPQQGARILPASLVMHPEIREPHTPGGVFAFPEGLRESFANLFCLAPR